MYKAITITKGPSGWGGPLTFCPDEKKNKVLSVTGGGIHPIAVLIAEMTGGEALDGFKTTAPDDEILCAVVDCGGTARCGVYPKKGIFTINLTPVGQAGPLAQFIKETNYVSDVKDDCITYAEAGAAATERAAAASAPKTKAEAKEEVAKMNAGKKKSIIARIGMAVGGVVGKFYQAGRETIEMVIKNVLPFMAFVTMILGIISASGIGDVIANTIAPVAGSLPGMILISLICALPFLSPVLGPGAVIAQVVGVLLGVQIGMGAIPPQFALPALFAINAQVGCDFVPVGLSLGEAEPETIEFGVPAVLFSRIITGPASVLIAFAFSFGLYS